MSAKITRRELGTTFRINFNNVAGTAFLRHGENGSYFVTAAHNLTNARVGDNILFQKDGDWCPATISYLAFDYESYDICVFSTSEFIAKSYPLPFSKPRGVLLGDSLMFLGFPHGLANSVQGEGYPIPLVRNAFFSGVTMIGDHKIMILDGFNNPGYSGAPVYDLNESGIPSLLGLISGYRPENRSHGGVYKINENGKEERIPDIYTKPNSGMILAISVHYIDRLAKAIDVFNPIS